MGQNGANESPGAAGKPGADEKGVKSTAITYQAGASQTSAPTGSWSTSIPKTTPALPYLWTRTVITYTDNTTSTSYSVSSTLDSVEIGGRNLLLKAKKPNVFGSSNILGTVSFSAWDAYAESNLVDVDWNRRYGELLTYRCWLDNTDETAFSNTGIMLHFRYADGTYKQFFSNSLSKGQLVGVKLLPLFQTPQRTRTRQRLPMYRHQLGIIAIKLRYPKSRLKTQRSNSVTKQQTGLRLLKICKRR